jgi:hypothetical protein
MNLAQDAYITSTNASAVDEYRYTMSSQNLIRDTDIKAAHSWLLNMTASQFDHLLINTGIHIIDNAIKLSFDQHMWLGTGLKFIPTPINIPANLLHGALDRFRRKLLWKIIFQTEHGKNSSQRSEHFVPKLYKKSNAEPLDFINNDTRISPSNKAQFSELLPFIIKMIGRITSRVSQAQRLLQETLKGPASKGLVTRRPTLENLQFGHNPGSTSINVASYTPFMQRTHSYRLPNLIANARKFLLDLRANDNIIIKAADKNLGLTIMSRRWYECEALRQLRDNATYEPITVLSDKLKCVTLYETIRNKIASFTANYPMTLCPAIVRYLRASYPNSYTRAKLLEGLPAIYFIPKVHKPTIKGRPIIASHSWLTTPISKVVDFILQPYVQKISTAVKDSRELVKLLEHTVLLPPHLQTRKQVFLVTADVEALYTNIQLDDGLRALRDFLYLDPLCTPLPTEVKDLVLFFMELILRNNFFFFKTGPRQSRQLQIYHQKNGTAMGTPAAVVFAIIYMYQTEKVTVEKYSLTTNTPHTHLVLYKRFIDDICAILIGTNPQDFIHEMDNLKPNIRMNWIISSNKNEFLDLELYLGNRFRRYGLCDLNTHQKSMNTYLYIPTKSFHSKRQLQNMIVNELQRYIRNSSSSKSFVEVRDAFYQRLRVRGYTPDFLDPLFCRKTTPQVDYRTRTALISSISTELRRSDCQYSIPCDATTSGKLMTLVVKNNPLIHAIQLDKIVHHEWETTKTQHNALQAILSDTLILSYPSPGSLKDMLCNNRS